MKVGDAAHQQGFISFWVSSITSWWPYPSAWRLWPRLVLGWGMRGPKEPSHHPSCLAGEPGGTGPALPQSCSLMQMAPCII